MSKLPTVAFRDGTMVVRRCSKCKRFVHANMIEREVSAKTPYLPVVYCPTKCKDFFMAELYHPTNEQ